MTTRNLEIFVKVVDCGKMSGAARAMSISQSSVSQAISDIESEYSVRLFERFSKKLYLTPIGEDLLNFARHFISIKKSMEMYLQQAGGIKGVRIGATLTIGTCVIGSIVSDFEHRDPTFRSEVFVANTHIIESKLLKSELDVALVEGKILHPNLITVPVIHDALVLACGHDHPFWGKEVVHMSDLANQNFVLREKGSGTRAQLEKQLIVNHIPYQIRWTCYNTEAIKNAVKNSVGITIISKRLIREECHQKMLWPCQIEEFSMKRTFDLVYHKNKSQLDLINELISVCQKYNQAELQGLNKIEVIDEKNIW